MRGHSSSALVLAVILLTTLPNCIQASFLGTLLFGKDTLEPVRNAIQQTEQLRQEVYGWYKHNATQQANFTVTPDPADVYKLLPADYSGRSMVAPDGSYYKDVEGYYKGEWSGWDFSTQANRSLATDSKLSHTLADKAPKGSDEPKYVEGVDPEKLRLDRGSFNWLTTELGHVDVHLREEHLLPGNVSLITGSLSFNQPKGSRSEEDSVDFSLEGLHFLPTGSLFLHALADETPHSTDVRTSLSLIPEGNNETTNATISAINKAFQLRIDMLQRIIDSGSYDGDDSPSVSPALKHNCSLHVYGQFSSAGPFAEVQPQIDALESEAKHSTGISTIPRPQLRLSLTAFSPECQVVLATHRAAPLTGLLQIRIWKKAVNYAIIYFLVLLLQTYLLVQQMEATATPSGLLKVSDKTFLAQYTITVYRAQADAGPSPPTAAEPAAGEGENTIFSATLNAITPTTNTNTATANAETTAEADRARRRGRVIFATGLFLFMVGFFPIFTITLLLPVLYSFWIPQIYRNVMRGTRKAILKRCVMGVGVSRLVRVAGVRAGGSGFVRATLVLEAELGATRSGGWGVGVSSSPLWRRGGWGGGESLWRLSHLP
ncbi:related to TUL1 - Golgi-localized RING-finger ubiquitin ligase [Ustilago bromivora]|uniref:RING-type E3 ubiquitin transferase n=1 Tax=Ustilago bromivora TaxID=307758 RepID=A0A8H8QP60_9BASI|nr:related to TUL1 - Golgi-localized RING-finger ubiquitin ligase [Ustilago bromivora]